MKPLPLVTGSARRGPRDRVGGAGGPTGAHAPSGGSLHATRMSSAAPPGAAGAAARDASPTQPPPRKARTAALAVHKRKVADVEGWLHDALYGPPRLAAYRRILALTGPSGSGKSATVHALAAADALDFDVVEWENRDAYFDSGDRLSAMERFAAFVHNALRFPALPLVRRHATARRARGRIILVDDLPNLAHEATRAQFHDILDAFAARSDAPHVPLVLVVSDAVPRTDDASAESSGWRARRDAQMDVRAAVPECVRRAPHFAEIRFNPATTRLVHGALCAAVEAQQLPFSRATLQEIADASGGDIRGAMASLAWTAASARESETPSDGARTPAVPQCARGRTLVDVEHLWDQLPMDAGTFHHYLAHNYPPFTDDVNECARISDELSTAALLLDETVGGVSVPAASVYGFHVAARGTLLGLPSPVARRGQQLRAPALGELTRRTRASADTVTEAQASSAAGSALRTASRAAWATEVLPLGVCAERLWAPWALALGEYAAEPHGHVPAYETAPLEDVQEDLAGSPGRPAEAEGPQAASGAAVGDEALYPSDDALSDL
ncbi:RFC checkpoint protein Rad17 [Malassezia sp. CBS 17886]|nr:RFC checkpoint protein Rad17 [Malassezia sp. CBS 17886]